MNLKKLAQIGLVLLVVTRLVGLVAVSFETYILVFVLINTAAVVDATRKGEIKLQAAIYQLSIFAVLVLPWGTVIGFIENRLMTSALLALTVYGLTQCYWGLAWPVELVTGAIALVRSLNIRLPKLPKRPAKTKILAEKEEPKKVTVIAPPPAPQQQAITPPVAKPVVPAVTPEIKSAPAMESRPTVMPEIKPVEKPVQPASVPEVKSAPIAEPKQASVPAAEISDEQFFAREVKRAREGQLNPLVFGFYRKQDNQSKAFRVTLSEFRTDLEEKGNDFEKRRFEEVMSKRLI